jgi:hypothetical protein
MVISSLYICLQVRSIYLVSSEKVKLAKAAVFLGIASFKLSIHMITDYCLYWVLTTIRQHGRVKTTVDGWFYLFFIK